MKCMCAPTRPRFILSSERAFGGMEFEPTLTPNKKIPPTGKFRQRRIEPATLWTARPNTTNELFRPPIVHIICYAVVVSLSYSDETLGNRASSPDVCVSASSKMAARHVFTLDEAIEMMQQEGLDIENDVDFDESDEGSIAPDPVEGIRTF